MSEQNAPENVTVDERFNQFTPAFLERALRLNFTATMRQAAKRSANSAMPLMLSRAMGLKASNEELEAALLDAYTTLAVVVELSVLIDKLAPLQEVDDIPEERREEVRNLLQEHPAIQEAVKVIKETVAELNDVGN